MGTNSMHVAKTGLNAQQRRMQVIANNLANVNTTGFKRERVNFETLLYQVLRSSGEQTSADTNLTSAFSVGTGVRVVNADKLFKLGSDGCIMVKMAIKVSTTPKAFGEVSNNLKDEIKRYAIRCNLSY